MKKKILLFLCLIMIGKIGLDYFYHPLQLTQIKNIKKVEDHEIPVKTQKTIPLSYQLNTYLKSLASLTLEEDYQNLLSNIKNKLNSPLTQKEFFNYYKKNMNGQTGLLESFFLNKILISIPGHITVTKELMAQNAYSKNNPFATYEIHLVHRPSENFNLGRAHLLELIQKNLSPAEVLKLAPELEFLIKKEQNMVMVREAIKTWIYATGKKPDKHWFTHRAPQDFVKLSDLI